MIKRADYFAAARALMADGDPRRVTIDALCQRVGATTGSFYHHFGGLDGFVDALAADWSEHVIAGMWASIADLGDLRGTRKLVNESLLLQNHQVEAAFRAWSRTSPAMRAAVQAVDDARRETSRIMVGELNPHLSKKDVETYSRITVLILAGAQALDPASAADVTASTLAELASFIERMPDPNPTTPEP